MTTTRLPHHRATPDRTGGHDRPQGACYGRPEPYDDLIDYTVGPRYYFAVREARAICATCPIRDTCLSSHVGEQWADAILGIDRPKDPMQQEKAKRGHQRRHEARLTNLRELIAQGAELPEVCERLGISQDGLYKWCHYHGYADEWRAIKPPAPEALAKVRRKSKEAA